MNQITPDFRFQQGLKALQANELENAFKYFAQSAFSFLFETKNPGLAKEVMEMTVACYQKLHPSLSLPLSEEPIEHYFRVIRHFEDHRDKEKNEIEEEIHKLIPSYTLDYFNDPQPEGKTGSRQHTAGPFFASVSYAQGPREEMEDAYLVDSFSVGPKKQHSLQVFAVFDGHGGSACARFTEERLSTLIGEELGKLSSFKDIFIYNALSRACIRMDKEWKELPFQHTYLKDFSGTTAALACILDEKELWTVNIGDSGIALVLDDQTYFLTERAKPTMPFYELEILRRGGTVLYGRVDGTLDMARSIGDLEHPSISARPTLHKWRLDVVSKKQDYFLIIGCDGLWDFVDPQQAANDIKEKSVEEASSLLKTLAYEKGSTDNVTVIVIDLHLRH